MSDDQPNPGDRAAEGAEPPSDGDGPLVSRRAALGTLAVSAGGVGGYAAYRNWDDAPWLGPLSGPSDDEDRLRNVDRSMPREDEIDDRIETNRTAGLSITVLDGQGEPVPDADVEVTMNRHEFGFGTAVNAAYLVDETDEGDRYRTLIPELFNKAVLENHHKWGFWEVPAERDRAEAATDWLLEQGLEMRGHACIWQKRDQGAIPDDVVEAMDDGDGDHIETRAASHIRDIVGYYSDVAGVTEWDVLNEQVEEHEMTSIIDSNSRPTNSPTAAEWFRIAAAADPDARLYLNEYSVLAGDETAHKDAFEELVDALLDRGAPLDGLGLQGHHWSPTQRRTPTQLLETLDRFAERVSSVQVHEYDTWGEEWSETMEAEYLYTFLKTVFSHPAVEGFIMWGFWDAIHWHENAPLFRSDWSKKPAYDIYTDLVFDEWWTDETGRTDDDGVFRTTAVLGEHEISATAGETTATATLRLEEPTDRAVTLSLEEE
ncbi:endo-1,4-beta-xylanase [Natrinema salaciae]|uniref:endo-1,4-beta-xylanase n=1 Tax=Natrinema salaciae TaxID=1186196 RepID=A0A1H9GNA3_9EURY|nr:endo-1,4-beta-xylanase [Natrinema salaciae]SEQ51622.1 Endo-1,4-beta-xylanase, GH35 family [Natrinema salaciae]